MCSLVHTGQETLSVGEMREIRNIRPITHCIRKDGR